MRVFFLILKRELIYLDINNINTDRDTSGLGPIEYDQTKVPALIRKHANNVRTKTYGQEVREAQARNAELAGLIASEAIDISNETKGRQDTVETQFNSVQQELTDKDPISAPEIIVARAGESTLSARLDKEHQNVNAQLAQTAKKLSNHWVHVKEFGAVGDGIANDYQAIQDALTDLPDNSILELDGLHYIDKPDDLTNDVFVLSGKKNITILGTNTYIDQTGQSGSSLQGLFTLVDCKNVSFHNIDYQGIGSWRDPSGEITKHTGALVRVTDNSQKVNLYNCHAENALALLVAEGTNIRDLYVDKSCTVFNCSYGVDLRSAGSDSVFNFTIEACHRAFFIRDVSNIKADYIVRGARTSALKMESTTTDCDINVTVAETNFTDDGYSISNNFHLGSISNPYGILLKNITLTVNGNALIESISVGKKGEVHNFTLKGKLKVGSSSQGALHFGNSSATAGQLTNLTLDIEAVSKVINTSGTGADVHILNFDNVFLKGMLQTISNFGLRVQWSNNVNFNDLMINAGGGYAVRLENTNFIQGNVITNIAKSVTGVTNDTLTEVVIPTMIM